MKELELQKEKDAFQEMISTSAYQYAKNRNVTIEVAFEAGAYFMQDIIRKKDSSVIIQLSNENMLLKKRNDELIEDAALSKQELEMLKSEIKIK